MTLGTVARYERVLKSFARFAGARGVLNVEGVDGRLCIDFALAPMSGRGAPAPSTSRFRLTVVRDACVGWLAEGAIAVDPTVGLRIAQPRSAHRPVPLTPPEVRRLRFSSRVSPRDVRGPSATELALLGATHLEVATTVVADLDSSIGSVFISCAGTVAREAQLDAFGSTILDARVTALQCACRRSKRPWSPQETALALARPLDTYPPETIAPGVSSTLARAMARAGLDRPELRPRSLREYAANRSYALTGRVEDVATMLGLQSLDTAYSFIDPAWQRDWASEMDPNVLA